MNQTEIAIKIGQTITVIRSAQGRTSPRLYRQTATVSKPRSVHDHLTQLTSDLLMMMRCRRASSAFSSASGRTRRQ